MKISLAVPPDFLTPHKVNIGPSAFSNCKGDCRQVFDTCIEGGWNSSGERSCDAVERWFFASSR